MKAVTSGNVGRGLLCVRSEPADIAADV